MTRKNRSKGKRTVVPGPKPTPTAPTIDEEIIKAIAGGVVAQLLAGANTKKAESEQATAAHRQFGGIYRVGQKLGLVHRNGKKPAIARTLLFTKQPYGFRETTIEEDKVKEAGITPAKDDQGDIYIVVKDKADAESKLKPWPGRVTYPKVTSETLGAANNWPEIPVIDQANKKSLLSQIPNSVWLIIVIVLIVIFFLGFFLLSGGK